MADRPRPASDRRPGDRKVGDASRRRAEKRKAQRRRRVVRVLVVVLVLAVVAAAVWAVAFSSLLVTRSVVVQGASLVPAAQVETVARVPLGVPVVRLDRGAVEQRVRELPEVRDVDVSVSVRGTVTVAVTERQPVYAMSAGAGYTLVDAEGAAFHSVGEATPGLLLANVSTPDDQRLRRDVATVVAALPPAIAERTVLVTARTPDQITLDLTGGVQLVWGSAEQSELKAQVAASLLAQPATVIDVSAPSHPAVRR